MKSTTITIRISDEDKERLHEVAKLKKMTVSRFINEEILTAIQDSDYCHTCGQQLKKQKRMRKNKK